MHFLYFYAYFVYMETCNTQNTLTNKVFNPLHEQYHYVIIRKCVYIVEIFYAYFVYVETSYTQNTLTNKVFNPLHEQYHYVIIRKCVYIVEIFYAYFVYVETSSQTCNTQNTLTNKVFNPLHEQYHYHNASIFFTFMHISYTWRHVTPKIVLPTKYLTLYTNNTTTLSYGSVFTSLKLMKIDEI